MPDIHVDAVIYEEEGQYIAHVLQLDLVGVGDTSQEAVAQLIEACIAQISHTIENDNMEHLFRTAPPEIWEMFGQVKKRAKVHKVPAIKAKSNAKKPTFTFPPMSLSTVAFA